MYSIGGAGVGDHKQLQRIEAHDLSNTGSIKEMALFSRIVNYQEVSTQKMKEDYGELHPKILDLGMRLINESYQSSNQRCIAMLLALKHFVNVIPLIIHDRIGLQSRRKQIPSQRDLGRLRQDHSLLVRMHPLHHRGPVRDELHQDVDCLAEYEAGA
jgi:hypothetical protein